MPQIRETRSLLVRMCQGESHFFQKWPLPNAIFEKNVTRLDTFAQVMSESREFGASGHCLI